jgi:hypothetical protein
VSEPVPKNPGVNTAPGLSNAPSGQSGEPENPETGYSAQIIEYGSNYLLWVLRARGSELYVLRPATRDGSGAYYPDTSRIFQFSDPAQAKEAAAKIKGVIEQ